MSNNSIDRPVPGGQRTRLIRSPLLLLLTGVFAVNIFIYARSAAGPYIVDDFTNLVNNPALQLQEINLDAVKKAALSSGASPFHRPLSMLSFAANYTLAGNRSAYPVKLTNIYIHVLTGFGIFLLTLELLRRLPESTLVRREEGYINLIAFTATCVWLFHPLFVSTVLYAVQRMAMLSALFVIFGCIGYLRLRDASTTRATSLMPIFLWISIVTLLGFLCKENGALLPGFLLLIEVFCFKFEFHQDIPRTPIRFLQLMLIAPTVFILAYLAYTYIGHAHEEIGNFYFTYQERLLTQLRVLWHYAGWLMFLNPEPMGIYHDDFIPSTSLVQPISTLPALIAWLALAGIIVRYYRSRNVLLFCMLWFLWGQVLESTVLPLTLMFEHRNYLPGYGLILGYNLLITGFMYTSNIRNVIKYAIITILFFMLPGYTFYERVTPWSDDKSLILSLMNKQPESPQTLIMAARYLNDAGDTGASLRAIRYAQGLDPTEAALIFAEAAVQCDNFPQQPFSREVVDKLRQVKIRNQGTVNTVTQLRLMVQVCRSSSVNYAVLLDLYQQLRFSHSKKLSYLAMFGYGYIQLHLGHYAAAIDAWEQVIRADKNAAVLKPQLEEIRKIQARQAAALQTGSGTAGVRD